MQVPVNFPAPIVLVKIGEVFEQRKDVVLSDEAAVVTIRRRLDVVVDVVGHELLPQVQGIVPFVGDVQGRNEFCRAAALKASRLANLLQVATLFVDVKQPEESIELLNLFEAVALCQFDNFFFDGNVPE